MEKYFSESISGSIGGLSGKSFLFIRIMYDFSFVSKLSISYLR